MKYIGKEVPTQPLPKGIAPKDPKDPHRGVIRFILGLLAIIILIGISQMK